MRKQRDSVAGSALMRTERQAMLKGGVEGNMSRQGHDDCYAVVIFWSGWWRYQAHILGHIRLLPNRWVFLAWYTACLERACNQDLWRRRMLENECMAAAA